MSSVNHVFRWDTGPTPAVLRRAPADHTRCGADTLLDGTIHSDHPQHIRGVQAAWGPWRQLLCFSAFERAMLDNARLRNRVQLEIRYSRLLRRQFIGLSGDAMRGGRLHKRVRFLSPSTGCSSGHRDHTSPGSQGPSALSHGL
jgi:hypothetical protein